MPEDRKEKVYRRNDILPFDTKHQEVTIDWCIVNDPHYLYWLINNVKWFKVTPLVKKQVTAYTLKAREYFNKKNGKEEAERLRRKAEKKKKSDRNKKKWREEWDKETERLRQKRLNHNFPA